MCGIVGLIGKKDKCLDPKLLSHRGPDAMGFWSSPDFEFPAQFGHSRLAILDLSQNGNQPFVAKDRYVFVFNGEIYNFLELRTDLESRGVVFKTQTDTEVLLYGLIEYGPSFQLQCNGMWAFCLWDRLKKTALFGRDRFGKKPLFYTESGLNGLVFASEMKALYSFLPSVRPSDRADLHLRYLFDYEHTDDCMVAGIRRLPPGHFAEYAEGKLTVKRWWNTLDHLDAVPRHYEEQVEKWREIFLDAVRIRMRSDVRIGTALSGGLDSSAIFSSMAYLANNSPVHFREAADWQHGFCAHYPGSDIDESAWAQMVTDSFGVPLEKVTIEPVSSQWSIAEAFRQVEDPYLTLPTPMLATYRAISNAGIKVTLDGHGADELFSGYGHLQEAYKQTGPREAAEITAIIKSLATGAYDLKDGGVYSNWIKHRLFILLRSGLHLPKNIAKFALGRVDWDTAVYKLQHEDFHHPNFISFDPLTKSLYEIFHITILPTLLRNYDRYSMASGVEVRMPFLDHRLVSYTFSLPWTSKVGGGFTKRIMRDALKGILPEPVRTRRDKIGWNAPMHDWLRGPLKTEVDSILSNCALPRHIQNIVLDFQKASRPSFIEGQRVWNLLLPILWKKSLFESVE